MDTKIPLFFDESPGFIFKYFYYYFQRPMNHSLPPQSEDIVKKLVAHLKELHKRSARPQRTKAEKDEAKSIQKDKKKILKLFNYQEWSQYMGWVQEKLEESGEDIEEEEAEDERSSDVSPPNEQESQSVDKAIPQQFKKKSISQHESLIDGILQQIAEQPQNESSVNTRNNTKQNSSAQAQSELLAIENARLRRDNIVLKNKLIQLRSIMYKNGMKNLDQ